MRLTTEEATQEVLEIVRAHPGVMFTVVGFRLRTTAMYGGTALLTGGDPDKLIGAGGDLDKTTAADIIATIAEQQGVSPADVELTRIASVLGGVGITTSRSRGKRLARG